MQPEPSFRETRVIEPRIGQVLPSRCTRTGHQYPDTAIELLALDIRGLAALIKIVPDLDSNDLVVVNTRNLRTAAPRASCNPRVQVSEPPESHEPTIRIHASRCCRSQVAARFNMLLPATVNSRLFGPGWMGCMRKGGSEPATGAWQQVAQRTKLKYLI